MSDDRLLPTLIIGLFVAFGVGSVLGYIVGTAGRESPQIQSQIPYNWNPVAASQADNLKTCMAMIAENAANCRKAETNVAH